MSKTLSNILFLTLGIVTLLIPYYIGYYNATNDMNAFVMIALYTLTLTLTDIRYKILKEY